MWKEEGFRGFMRGNGINCVRIIPYSAVQFTTYEQLKKVRLSTLRSHPGVRLADARSCTSGSPGTVRNPLTRPHGYVVVRWPVSPPCVRPAFRFISGSTPVLEC